MKKQIFPLLISLGFLCSFFVVQAAGELSPVQPGRGYLADGVNDYIQLDSFITLPGEFDIRMEVSNSNAAVTDMVLGNSTNYIKFGILNGKIFARLFDGGGSDNTIDFSTDGDIHYIRFTRNSGNKVDVYIDNGPANRLFSDVAQVGSFVFDRIGTDNQRAQDWGGKIGDIQVRDGNGKLLHSWHLDEGSGTTSFDSVREWKGLELVTNGGFDADSDWVLEANWLIADGVATHSTTGSERIRTTDNILEYGKRYFVEFDVTDYVSGTVGVYGDSGSGETYNYIGDSVGHFSIEVLNRTQTKLYFRSNDFIGSIDNIFIKELHSPSHGTITNATESTFHTTDTDFKSYQNDVGYSIVENLILNSEDLSQANWAKYDLTATGGYPDPDGGNNAWKITKTDDAGPHLVDVALFGTDTGSRKSKIWVRGSGTVYIGGNSSIAPIVTLTDVWKLIETTTVDANAGNAHAYIADFRGDATAIELYVYHPQFVTDFSHNYVTTEATAFTDLDIKIPLALDKNSNPTTQDIYGNDASYIGRTRTKAELVGKNVAVFDGVDDYVDCGNDSNPVADEFVIEAEVYWDNTIGGAYGGVMTTSGSVSPYDGHDCYIQKSSGKIGSFKDGGFRWSLNSITPNTWQKIKWKFVNGANGALYTSINGSEYELVYSSVSGWIRELIGAGNLQIGRWTTSANHVFGGKMRDIKIYADGTLINNYTLSEGAGTTAYDTVPTWYGDDITAPVAFTNTTYWTPISTTPVDANTFTSVGGAGIVDKSAVLVAGKKYRVRISGTTTASLGFRVVQGTSSDTRIPVSESLLNNFDNTFEFVVSDTTELSFYLRNSNAGETTINEWIVQEVYEPVNGTVTNADLDTFWATDMDAPDQNLVNGYSNGRILSNSGTVNYGYLEGEKLRENINGKSFYLQFNAESTQSDSYARLIGQEGKGILYLYPTTGRLQLYSGVFDTALTTNTVNLLDNKWHELLVNFNSDDSVDTVYLDGELQALNGSPAASFNITTLLTVGNRDTFTRGFNGEVANWKVFDAKKTLVQARSELGNYLKWTDKQKGSGKNEVLKIPAQSGKTGLDINGTRLTHSPQNLRYSAMAYKNVGVFDGVDDYVEIPMSSAIQPETYLTLEAWVNPNVSYVGDIILLGQSGYYLTIGSDWSARVYWYGKTPAGYHSSGANTVPAGKWTHVVAAWNESSVKIYINGALKNTIVSTGVGSSPVNQLWIGTEYAGATRQFHGSISDVRIYNRALSVTDIEKLYQGETINNNGLVAHYPLSEGAGTTVYNAAPTWYGKNLVTNGHFFGDSGWSKQAGWTISGGVATCDGTQAARTFIVQNVGRKALTKYKLKFDLTVNSGFFSIGDASLYLVGSGSSGLTQSGSYEFLVTMSTSTAGDIYLHGFNNFNGTVDNFSVQEIHEPTNGTITNTTPATFWKIDNTAPVSQSYTNGFSQGLVNTTAGTAYTPSDVAYGEWEFDLYKGVDSNVSHVHFVNDTTALNNGYLVGFAGSERLYFLRWTNGVVGNVSIQTAPSYVSNNTWYRIKMTRSSAGVFTVYIKGGEFGDEYVLVVPETGTNPVTDNTYTTSNYFVTDLDAGDQIANVQIDGHRASVHEFELGTGAYDKLFIPSQTGRGMDVLESVKQIMGTTANSVFTSADLVIIAAQKLAREGINYWDVTTRKFFTGQSDGSLSDFVPNTERVKTTSELATINTNKTADVDHNYWDTTLRKFLRGLADGTLQDFMTWYAER